MIYDRAAMEKSSPFARSQLQDISNNPLKEQFYCSIRSFLNEYTQLNNSDEKSYPKEVITGLVDKLINIIFKPIIS